MVVVMILTSTVACRDDPIPAPFLVQLEVIGQPRAGQPLTLVGTVVPNTHAVLPPEPVTVEQFGFLIPDTYSVVAGVPSGLSVEPSTGGSGQRAFWRLAEPLGLGQTFRLEVTPTSTESDYEGVLAMAWYPYPQAGISDTLWIRAGREGALGDVRETPP